MPKGYKELIHDNTTTISTSTYISNSNSPHATTLETVFTHLTSRSFHTGERKKPPLCNISPLYSLPKRGEDLSAFVHISLKC